jgi:hypothetical protein
MSASDPPPPTASPDIGGAKYRLIQELIGRPPIDVIKEMRAQVGPRGDGPPGAASFNTIAVKLAAMSGESLTYESVRRWWETYCIQEEERVQLEEQQARRDRAAAARKTNRRRKADGGIPPALFSGGEQ